MTTRPTTSTYTDVLDTYMYDGPVQLARNWMSPMKDLLIQTLYKTRVVPMILILQMVTPMLSYADDYSIDQLQLYTHSRIINFNEFICLNSILTQESHYNYLARNGNHYGIGQMGSRYYQSRDPYRQIDMTIAYIHKRYKTMCKALTFHKKHGYY